MSDLDCATVFMEKPLTPPKDWLDRVEHVLEAIADIERDTAGMDRQAFLEHDTQQRAVLWSLQVIGEAIRWLPPDLRERYPDVEWHAIRAMRNVIVHNYDSIKIHRVWEAVQNGLPELKAQMQQLQADIERRGDAHP